MKLKKILAGALAGIMVLGSAVSVMAENVDESKTYSDGLVVDGTSEWNSGGGDQYLLKDDFDVTVDFYNEAFLRDASNWSNFVFEIFGGEGTKGITLRADAYGWTYGEEGASEPTYENTNSWDGDWTNWATICDKQNVSLTASKTSDTTVTVDIKFETSGESEQYVITYPDGVPSEMRLQVGADGGKITINKFTDNKGIYLNDLTVLIDATKALTLTRRPAILSGDVTYVSDNEEVATVDADGNVTGVAVGTANITATCGDYTATCVVTVTDEAIPLTAITATADKTDLTVGGTATITTGFEPADTTDDTTVAFTSSDEKIITVDENGVVTAVAAGTAKVTVAIGSLTKEIEFTVTEAAVVEEEEEEIVVPEGSETLECGDFWTTFSQAFELTTDELVITCTTKNNGDSNWNNLLYVIYNSEDTKVYPGDSEQATSGFYSEYWVARADNFGWGLGEITETNVGEDFDWETWLAATQEGATVTITAKLDGDNAVITLECAGVKYTSTVPVDTSKPVYLALTGEKCTLSDLTVNGEATLFGNVSDEGTPAGGGSDDDKKKDSPKTADATPVIPVAVALLGCAVVVVASKKKLV